VQANTRAARGCCAPAPAGALAGGCATRATSVLCTEVDSPSASLPDWWGFAPLPGLRFAPAWLGESAALPRPTVLPAAPTGPLGPLPRAGLATRGVGHSFVSGSRMVAASD